MSLPSVALSRTPTSALPGLVEVHRSTAVGERVRVIAPGARWSPERLRDMLVGAGFRAGRVATVATVATVGGEGGEGGEQLVATATRQLSLPDTVAPRMTLLVSGLNPSVYAAEAGIGFARPGNRFWPAALAAGLVTVDRSPDDALRAHGVGMTDLVKRATPRADALTPDEYRDGLARVARLAAWLRPGAICFVGLAGWRAGFPRARAGVQDELLGGRPVYVMPSTSGLNARVPLADLAEHLRAARDLGVN